jgi:hypothetical protein
MKERRAVARVDRALLKNNYSQEIIMKISLRTREMELTKNLLQKQERRVKS